MWRGWKTGNQLAVHPIPLIALQQDHSASGYGFEQPLGQHVRPITIDVGVEDVIDVFGVAQDDEAPAKPAKRTRRSE